ncbi:MAG: hypothetical protein M3247_07155, partial [Thermoproteota archaeon]|nr:hypothetical protein [Thermoproteota archaeon]
MPLLSTDNSTSSIEKFFHVDDHVLKSVGINYVTINGPKLYLELLDADGNNATIDVNLTRDWNGKTRLELIEKIKQYNQDPEVITRLETCVGN